VRVGLPEECFDLLGLFEGVDAGGFIVGDEDFDAGVVFEGSKLFERFCEFEW
jgi:hypothetical protein